jgi:hypothetical protein
MKNAPVRPGHFVYPADFFTWRVSFFFLVESFFAFFFLVVSTCVEALTLVLLCA